MPGSSCSCPSVLFDGSFSARSATHSHGVSPNGASLHGSGKPIDTSDVPDRAQLTAVGGQVHNSHTDISFQPITFAVLILNRVPLFLLMIFLKPLHGSCGNIPFYLEMCHRRHMFSV